MEVPYAAHKVYVAHLGYSKVCLSGLTYVYTVPGKQNPSAAIGIITMKQEHLFLGPFLANDLIALLPSLS